MSPTREGELDRLAELRRQALDIFRAGLAAADPGRAVARALRLRGERLDILLDPDRPSAGTSSGVWSRIHLIAVGKAACAMAGAARDALPGRRLTRTGIVVTDDGNARAVEGLEVLSSGHPLPDARGVAASRRVADLARRAGAGDLVLVLLSGGGSALLPAPAAGLSLEDKVRTTGLLLASGADIGELNTVRKHLSVLKGGGLARLAAPADLHALILSDVIGDDLSTIASGPTVADPTTFADAVDILARRDLLDRVPATVREHLERGQRGEIAETPKPGDVAFERSGATLVGSNTRSLDAAAARAREILGDRVRILSRALCGEARTEAVRLAHALQAAARPGDGTSAVLAGGETTVTVRGRGRGGRNQELALAFALAAERLDLRTPWCFLSGGTDGRDGPTDAAGGIVDAGTVARMRRAAARGTRSPEASLEDNDAYHALEAAGDLLVTGATGSNVADLQIALVAGGGHFPG